MREGEGGGVEWSGETEEGQTKSDERLYSLF